MPTFRIERAAIPATVGGLFGDPPDTHAQHVAGPARYFVDDREVSEAQYIAAVDRWRAVVEGREDREAEDRERHEAQSVTGAFETPCGVDGCSVCDGAED